MLPSSYKYLGNDLMNFRSSTWMKVFHHNSTGKDYFKDEEEAVSLITEKKFNKLSYINDAYKVRGKFEFIIDWPHLNDYYVWRQDKNPLFEYESEDAPTASGFEPLRNASEASYCVWGGLVRTTRKFYKYINSLIKGCTASKQWHFAVGMYNQTDGRNDDSGIPSHRGDTDLVEVWIRLPKRYLRFNTCKTRQSYSRIFLFTLVLASS